MQLFKKQKTFFRILFTIFEIYINILTFSKEKVILIAYVFPEWRTPKNLARELSKRPNFRTSFENQHATGSHTLLKPAREHFYHICLSLWWKWNWEMSLLVISDLLRLFVNTLTPMTSILIVIVRIYVNQFKCNYQRKKAFSEFFAIFLKFA